MTDEGRFSSMRSLVEEQARGVVGREDVVSAVQAAAAVGKGRTVLVVGDAGSGKTAALAALAAADPSAAVHLVGPDLGRDDPRLVARSLAAQLGVTSVPHENGAAIEAMHSALRAIGDADQRAVVIVDAIDRLRSADDGAALELLPSVVPPGVLFVLSARPGAVADAIGRLPGVGRLALAPLRDDARLALARAIAPDRADEDLEVAARGCDGHPLLLRAILLAAEAGDVPPPTPEIAFGRMLGRLVRTAAVDVPRALGLLAVSRSGLTLDDLAALLASPPGAVESLVTAAGPWLHERGGRIAIADGRFRDWALVQSGSASGLAALHSAIADRLAAGAASKRVDALLDLSGHLEAAGRGAEIPDLVDGGRFPRLKATALTLESLRDDLVRAARASENDVVRAARYGLAAALLAADAATARMVHVKTLAASARGLAKKDAWELAERAAHEAVTDTDPARRDTLVVAAVTALRAIDAAEARRVASGQPRGAARVRAFVAAGDLASALAEAEDTRESEREEALAEVLEAMAADDAQEVMKLLPRLHDPAHRDGVLVALVASTKGIFLAGKIADPLRRVTALARIGEWDEAELAADDVAAGAQRAAAHERIAVAARAVQEDARAATHEAHAQNARDEIVSPSDRAASFREAAAIAIEAHAARARDLLDQALALDPAYAPTRAALVLRARAAIARPSGADLHEAIATLAPLGDALADVYPDLASAIAAAFGARYPEAARATADGSDWAERFVASLREPVLSKTIPAPALAPAIARAVSALPWVSAPVDSAIQSIEQRVRDDAATPEDVDRLVDARLAVGDRTGAVGALLGWASRLRARGDRVDAAAAEERARAIDPGDPRHPPASKRPPADHLEPVPSDEHVDGGWDDDVPRTVRQDVPRGDPPWSKLESPMAASLATAPTVSARTATILGIAAVPASPPPPAPVETPTAPPAGVQRRPHERTLRSAEGIPELAELATPVMPIEPTAVVSLGQAAPSEPPPDEIEVEDAADQTSIMGAAERKALQKATRTGDAAVVKEAAEKIAAERDAEERALAKESEGYETARKMAVARPIGDAEDPDAFERPTGPPAATAEAPPVSPARASTRPTSPSRSRPPAAEIPKSSSPALVLAIVLGVIAILAVAAKLLLSGP